ncbi:MAG: exo-alpha-sialidase [Bacteroides sp.]|nr:exo-alpha-sialidase [Bacteroides sp.]
MRSFPFKTIIGLSTAAVAMVMSSPLRADWEQVHSLPNTYAHFITSEGVNLMSDYRDNRDGGIYYSEDGGATWTKSEVRDYWFSNFYEADGYIFAIGSGCRIGRSEDGGRTWDLLNYSKAIEDWVPNKVLDATVCYAITVLDGVLYAGDFSGGGVICSNDYGETWEMTDRDSLYIYFTGESEPQMDSFYHLEAFKGMVYAFGLYSVHAYIPEEKNGRYCQSTVTAWHQ